VASPTVSIARRIDLRQSSYRLLGDYVAVIVDLPAIAFTLRWRRDPQDTWRVRPLAVTINGRTSEAWLGEVMCGMVENVPAAFLERGIEATLTAKLPDGREVPIPLPNPLKTPPRAPHRDAARPR
jgi:hypothetical protein